jgi:hypothetical protein
MWSWFTFWLSLHILAVIVAFGPTAAFGLIGAYAQRNPQWAVPSTAIMDLIERRLTVPLAVVVPLLGTALIFTAHVDLWHSEWLLLAIVLYTLLFFYAVLVQVPTTTNLLHALEALPPGPPPAGSTGPPPEIAKLGARVRFGGILLSVLLVTILVLMVWRPGDCRIGC